MAWINENVDDENVVMTYMEFDEDQGENAMLWTCWQGWSYAQKCKWQQGYKGQ